MKKAQKPHKTSSRGKNPYLKFSKQKNVRMERLLKKVTTFKNVAVLHDSCEVSCGDDSACSSGGSESDCKD